MKKTLSRGLAGALCVGLMIGSCVSVGAEGETADNLGKILFLQTHNNNSFMSYMGEVFVKLAEEKGFEVDHLTADSDEGKQLSQIEQGISSGEYVGIICDCTGEGVTQGFKEAKEAGLYVMTLHEGVEDNTYVDCIVACSLAETGYEAISLEVEELVTILILQLLMVLKVMVRLLQSERDMTKHLKNIQI